MSFDCKDVVENIIMVLRTFDDTQIEEAYDAMYDDELFEIIKETNDLAAMAALSKSVFKALEYIVDNI